MIECGAVLGAGQDQKRPVIGDDGVCALLVAGSELGQILPDRDELVALFGGGGCDRVEVVKGSDVGSFVEYHE